MITLSKNMRVWSVGLITVAVVLAVFVNFTDAFQLKSVYLNGREIENWNKKYPALSSHPVINQKFKKITNSLLDEKGIYKVDLSVSLPHTLEIVSNSFEPLCFILNSDNQKLMGIDYQGRLIPLADNESDWEKPVIFGAKVGQVYQRIKDVRTIVLVEKLVRLKREHLDLFRMIEEIDVSNDELVKVVPDGLEYYLEVNLERFNIDLERYVSFVEKYPSELDRVKSVNLCSNELIICRE